MQTKNTVFGVLIAILVLIVIASGVLVASGVKKASTGIQNQMNDISIATDDNSDAQSEA